MPQLPGFKESFDVCRTAAECPIKNSLSKMDDPRTRVSRSPHVRVPRAHAWVNPALTGHNEPSGQAPFNLQ